MPEANIFDGIGQTYILPATAAMNSHKPEHKKTFM